MPAFADMSLVELKQLAKTRKIKQYYIMKKEQLIELLTMEELPFKYKLEKMTITELRQVAKERGMRGFWGLAKEELSQLLFPVAKDEKQEDGKACKHENPQSEDPNKVGVQISEDPFEQRTNNPSLNG